MAEFQTVIKQFKRLCISADRDCSRCELNDMNYSIADIVNNSIDFEKRVMDWAAEHPEPVYPTWGDWLADQGVVIKDKIGENKYKYNTLRKVSTPIPADIAQKLGVKPKEG